MSDIPLELIENIIMFQIPTYNYMNELKETFGYSLDKINEYITKEFWDEKELLDFCINEIDEDEDEYCYDKFIFYVFDRLGHR